MTTEREDALDNIENACAFDFDKIINATGRLALVELKEKSEGATISVKKDGIKVFVCLDETIIGNNEIATEGLYIDIYSAAINRLELFDKHEKQERDKYLNEIASQLEVLAGKIRGFRA